MANWIHEPLAIADFNIPNPDSMAEIDPVQAAEVKSALCFNAEHLPCHVMNGGERGHFYFKTSAAEVLVRDFLAEYIPEAAKRGIRILAYFNVHWLNTDFGSKHPEFLQILHDGRPIDWLYGKGMSPCVNSEPYRDWSFQVLKDLGDYEIDGVFLDGPVFYNGTCYCEFCGEKFENLTGCTIPDWNDRTNPLWRQFIQFRYDSIAEYLRDARAILLGSRPDAVIYMNGQGLWPGWPNGRDNRRLAKYQDLIGAEGGFIGGKLDDLPLWKPAMSAKLLETQAESLPRVIFIAGAHKGWDNYLLTPAETKLLYADTIANGANPWYGIYYAQHGSPGARAAGEMNRFVQENSQFLIKTTSIANVALVWSSATADYYRASVPVTDFTSEGSNTPRRAAGDHSASFRGWFDVLVRGQFAFDVLDDMAIESVETLSGYETVVLPNCACMSDDAVQALIAYVKSGGTVVATFETGRYNEWGDQAPEFRLADLFGAATDWETFGPFNIDYISVRGNSPITRELSAPLIPAPTFGVVMYVRSAEAIAYYHGKMPARYHDLPPLTNNPAIIVNRFGSGSSVYFAGTFDESFAEFSNPDHENVLQASVSAHSARLVRLGGAARSVEVTLRRQVHTGRLLVYLVNFTGEMRRPIRHIVPLHEIQVSLAQGLAQGRKVRLLRSGIEQPIREENGRMSFTVPKLEVFEIAVV